MLSLECSWLACGRNSYSPCHSVLLSLIIYDPHATQKASVDPGCIVVVIISYHYKSCLYTFWHFHPYFILQFYSIVFIFVAALFLMRYCNYSKYNHRRWEVGAEVRVNSCLCCASPTNYRLHAEYMLVAWLLYFLPTLWLVSHVDTRSFPVAWTLSLVHVLTWCWVYHAFTARIG